MKSKSVKSQQLNEASKVATEADLKKHQQEIEGRIMNACTAPSAIFLHNDNLSSGLEINPSFIIRLVARLVR